MPERSSSAPRGGPRCRDQEDEAPDLAPNYDPQLDPMVGFSALCRKKSGGERGVGGRGREDTDALRCLGFRSMVVHVLERIGGDSRFVARGAGYS